MVEFSKLRVANALEFGDWVRWWHKVQFVWQDSDQSALMSVLICKGDVKRWCVSVFERFRTQGH